MSVLKKINEKSKWAPITYNATQDLISFEELTKYDIENAVIYGDKFVPVKQPAKKETKFQIKEAKNKPKKKENDVKIVKEIKNKRKISKSMKRKLALLDEDEGEVTNKTTKTNDKNVNAKKTKKETKKSKAKSMNGKTENISTQDGNPELDMSAWKQFNVPDEVLRALQDSGFDKPTPIQEQVLPAAIRNKQDILGAAETGSGKTLAFGIPLLFHMMEDRSRGMLRKVTYEENAKEDDTEEIVDDEELPDDVDVKQIVHDDVLPALILTPTRELAIQVKDHLVRAGKYCNFRFVAIVGGMAMQKQERLLRAKPEVIIATPGRLWELYSQGEEYLQNLHMIRYFIIDEADRMLEHGHFEELSKILKAINSKRTRKVKRQTMMFSATLTTTHDTPGRLRGKKKSSEKEIKLGKLVRKIGMREKPFTVDLTTKCGTAAGLYEAKMVCSDQEKDLYLYYFLKLHPGRTLVFTNSIDCIFHISGILSALNLPILTLHAKMQQRQRLKNVDRFHDNPISILVASDVAARGLDIPGIEHVVHYQVPRTAETYIHRSGRSARSGKEGLSMMLIGPSEFAFYKRVMNTLNKQEIADFPFEPKHIDAIRKLMEVAKEIDFLSHKDRKTRAHNDWFSKNAAEMDMELDEDLLITNSKAEEEHRKLTVKKQQLKMMLKTPLFPKNFTGKYLTLHDGSTELPITMDDKGDALTHLKKTCKRKTLNT